MSLSADGTNFVVGAPRHDGMDVTDSGHVRVCVHKLNSVSNSYTQIGSDHNEEEEVRTVVLTQNDE